MTPKQAEMLAAIRDLTRSGVAPSYRELAAHLGMKSISHVYDRLRLLREAGLVHFTAKRRSLIVLGDLVSPAALNALDDSTLHRTLGHIAGIVASRRGDFEAATTLRRIADALLTSPKAAERAA